MASRLTLLVCWTALASGALHCGRSSTAPVSHAPTANGSPSGVGSGDGAGAGESSPEPARAEAITSPASAAPSGAAEGEAPATELDDAQIAAITDAVNAAEIEQARLARAKGKDPRVKDFAAMMLDHHGEAREEQASIGVEKAETAQSTEVTRETSSAFQALQHKSGADFDRAYIQLQIDMHRKLLDRLSRELLPAARDARLRAYLEDMKPKLEIHLAKAEQIQSELATPGVDPRLTTTVSGSASRRRAAPGSPQLR